MNRNSNDQRPRVCVVTGGHLSTCPRMLKVARTLSENGYQVRVVHARYSEWADVLDRSTPLCSEIRTIDIRRRGTAWRWFYTAARRTVFNRVIRTVPLARTPSWALFRGNSTIHPELVREILRSDCQFIYGGTGPALSAVAEAARIARLPYALDLEDFHSQEHEGDSFADRVSEEVERRTLSGARFLTTSCASIAMAYHDKYGVAPATIHNVFSLPDREPDFSVSASGRPILLYWFSQTIGPGRGLEEVISAIGQGQIHSELHLRGTASDEYERTLRAIASSNAPRLRLSIHPAEPPDRMVDLARGYDIGLSVEQTTPRNHDLCLSNKALTYMLAGLALVLTDTEGHRELMKSIGEACLVYPSGRAEVLAAGLRQWSVDRSKLIEARKSAWRAARDRWHWDHEEEKGKMLRLVAGVIGPA